MLHLTFDDGPDPVWTPAVLAALGREGAHATFFVVTTEAERYPGLIEQIEDEGHTIGLHCHEHTRHTTMSGEEIERDTHTALEILAGLGVEPSLWRVPWGVSAPATEATAAARGLTCVHWTIDTEDWRGDPATEMLARVVPRLRPAAIVLAHDGIGPGARRTTCDETVALIGPLVEAARERGLDCTPVPERSAA